MKKLGVAVVGLGVGQKHAEGFLRAGCDLRAVYDLDAEKARRIVGELGHGKVAPSFEAILADPAVDVVALATYDDHHASAVIEALSAQKHVFCEKPLCRTADEIARIESAWKKSGRQLASNLVLRTAPLYRSLRARLATGELGEVYAFYGDYLYGRLSKITEGWRADVDDYSVMQGGGVHMVDLMCWLTNAKPAEVRSVGNRIATRGTKFRYDDFVSATFACDGGMLGTISANFACVHRHQHVVRIFGTRATFLYDDMGARIYRQRDPGGPPEMVTESALPAAKGDLIPDFLAGIQDEHLGEATTARDILVMRACLASDEALRTASTVRVAAE